MNDVPCMWHPNSAREENVYLLFQTPILIEEDGFFQIRMFGSNAYRAYLDGEEFVQGPARFVPGYPEYDECSIEMKRGEHVISVNIHFFGISTRFAAPESPPFLQCELEGKMGRVPLHWRCRELDAYSPINRRLNNQLGWTEICDMRKIPLYTLIQPDADWVEPAAVNVSLGDYKPKSIADCRFIPVAAKQLADGVYADRFGYVDDDPPVRFMLRDLAPRLPADGIWLRFDLERIGLYFPTITLEVPGGIEVEAGYSEALTDERVAPFITLSASASCSMDRWITRDGLQTLQTFSPRGFRFLELHIAAPAALIRQVNVTAVQRTYFDKPIGSFHCSDPLLNEIWQMGVSTLQACSEDALTDTPTRERGQWLGDAVAVGLETLSVSFGDLSLIRRSLIQAAQCSRSDGMVAGLYPGQNLYLSSYALLWISGCMRYYSKTGDLNLLSEVYETAVRTLNVFLSKLTPRGTWKPDCWDFIDWGHVVDESEINVSLNLLMLGALRDLASWDRELGYEDVSLQRTAQAQTLEQMMKENYFSVAGLAAHAVPLEGVLLPEDRVPGYHATVLALWFGWVEEDCKSIAVAFVKEHILSCFPNDRNAPRLANPGANHSRLITPYFSHFAMHVLWEAGETDFVLDQYRVCWGWMSEQGATTLLEVFDTRWSHCHAWSACPTWQLSAHLLGLLPDESGDPTGFCWNPKPGSLNSAEGRLPILNSKGHIDMKWRKHEQRWFYELQTDHPINLRLTGPWRLTDMVLEGSRIQEQEVTSIRVEKNLNIVFMERQ